jgi:hypothetical protein
LNKKLSPGNLTILIAGAVALLGSFLDFYSFGRFHSSAWSSGLRWNATLPAILGAIMALHVVLTTFANISPPRQVAGFTWNQIHLLFGFQALVMMVCWAVRDKSLFSFGAGFYLLLLGSIALFIGAVMRSREPASA